MSETRQPLHPSALRLEAPTGLASYPPVEKWDRYGSLAAKSGEALSDYSDHLF